MARQPDIQYVQFYTAGSAARKLEEPKRRAKNGAKLPKLRRKPDQRKVIRIDPVELWSLCTALVMLVCMVIGMMEFGQLTQQADQMEQYGTALSAENAKLQASYRAGYDLKDVEQKALDMGFVPEDQLQHVTVKVQVPSVEVERTGWQEFWYSFAELFA